MATTAPMISLGLLRSVARRCIWGRRQGVVWQEGKVVVQSSGGELDKRVVSGVGRRESGVDEFDEALLVVHGVWMACSTCAMIAMRCSNGKSLAALTRRKAAALKSASV